jgi:hypothetical protein
MSVSRRKDWSGRDLNSGPPSPKVNSRTLSSCLVYVFRASYIMVYGGIRRLLFPNCSQVLGVRALAPGCLRRHQQRERMAASVSHPVFCSSEAQAAASEREES